jgi:hypothetical protein
MFKVDDAKVDREILRYDVWISLRDGARLDCQRCGEESQRFYGMQPEREWRHVDYGICRCYIHFRQPRLDCCICGIHTWTPPWARKGSHFTNHFEESAMQLARSMPMDRIGLFLGEYDKRVWGIVNHHVSEARRKADYSGVEAVNLKTLKP